LRWAWTFSTTALARSIGTLGSRALTARSLVGGLGAGGGAGERRIDHALENESSLVSYAGALQSDQTKADYAAWIKAGEPVDWPK
jgi:hypothetical protein